jgi:hypothetical protein
MPRRSVFRLLGDAAAGVALWEGAALIRPDVASATTVVPQAGPVPIVIDQTATTDMWRCCSAPVPRIPRT